MNRLKMKRKGTNCHQERKKGRKEENKQGRDFRDEKNMSRFNREEEIEEKCEDFETLSYSRGKTIENETAERRVNLRFLPMG